HSGIPIAVRVTEMPNCPAKAVLELLLAGADFFPGLCQAKPGQVRMGEGMRSDFVPSGQPFLDLDLAHQGLSCLPFLNLPLVAAADPVGCQEFNGTKSMAGQRLQAMLKYVGETVI